MPGVVTTKFKLNNAIQFEEAFGEPQFTNIYLFIGRPWAFPGGDTPPVPTDNVRATEYDLWLEMISAKKVTTNDVSFAIDRNDWITSTIYEQYRDDLGTVWANNYHVFTDDFNVYKCLFNNGAVVSTVKPTGTANTPVTTGDGYIWKYMYTVAAGEALKFLTPSFLNVQTLTADDGSIQWDIQTTAGNGAIDVVDVLTGGSAYDGNSDTAAAGNSTTITLAASASATVSIYTGSEIYITSGAGSGQKREINNYSGGTKLAHVTPVWTVDPDVTSTYELGPKVVLSGDGNADWLGYTTVVAGAVDSITVVNGGTNYANASLAITANNGTAATAHGHISPTGGHGSDAREELAGHNVMLNVKLAGNEVFTHTTNNDFRVIGLIKDPVFDATGLVANSVQYDQTTRLAISSISGTFTKDEEISGDISLATGKMVDANSTIMRLATVQGTFSTADTITGDISTQTAAVDTINSTGDLRKHTGEVLYLENRAAITRNLDQTEDIKILIRF